MSKLARRVAAMLPRRLVDAVAEPVSRAMTAWRLLRKQRSAFVSRYLDGLHGVEIGASSHNPYYLDAINVDRYPSDDTIYKRHELRMAGRIATVDVVAPGDALPFADDSYDFVFAAHVIEHFPDPLKALYEWVRVGRRYVVVVVPHRDRTFDSGRPLSGVQELMDRHRQGFTAEEDRHWSVWNRETFLAMCAAAGLRAIDSQDPDDKVGNGFAVVIDASASPRA
jgi:SAM-dependent methyltransferase